MIKIDKQDNLIDMTSVQWLILYILCEFYALDYFGIRFLESTMKNILNLGSFQDFDFWLLLGRR